MLKGRPIFIMACLIGFGARAGGPTALQLQGTLAAGPYGTASILAANTDASAATVTAIGTTMKRSLASRYGDSLNVKDFGAACDGVTNDYAALAAVQAAGQAAGSAEIIIPSGCQLNLNSQLVYTTGTSSWRFGTGSAIISGGIQGLLDTSTLNNVTYSRSSSIDANENDIAAYALYNASTGTASYQKNGFYTRVTSGDPSTYVVGTLSDAATVPKDVVGYESQVQAGANMTARLYGYHSQLSFPLGTDGNGNVAEFELYNAGAYTPQTGKATSKRILHLDNVGPNDIGEGVQVFGGITTGKFYVGYDTFQTSIRSDGYAIGYWDDPRNDMTRVPLFGIAQDGHVIAPSIVLTSAQAQSTVLAAPATAAGAPSWRQLAVADVGGAAPSATPVFTGSAATFNAGLTATASQFTGDVAFSGNITTTGAVRSRAGTLTQNSLAAYTLQATDCGTIILGMSATAATWTVPAALPLGCRVTAIQETAASVTFAGATGIGLHALATATRTSGQYAKAEILIDTSASFILSGNVQ